MYRPLLKYFLFLAFTGLAGCNNKSKETQEQEPDAAACTTEKKFEMYEMSEMASLMEQMYAENMQLKGRIISGNSVGDFPDHILKIHSAVMTDGKENDDFFKAQAAKFIASQKAIYNDPDNAKEHFNNAVSSCVACHQQKCQGPIPRIKKLYINK